MVWFLGVAIPCLCPCISLACPCFTAFQGSEPGPWPRLAAGREAAARPSRLPPHRLRWGCRPCAHPAPAPAPPAPPAPALQLFSGLVLYLVESHAPGSEFYRSKDLDHMMEVAYSSKLHEEADKLGLSVYR